MSGATRASRPTTSRAKRSVPVTAGLAAGLASTATLKRRVPLMPRFVFESLAVSDNIVTSVKGGRSRGRAGALGILVLTAIVVSLGAFKGSPTGTINARPAAALIAVDRHLPTRPVGQLPPTLPAWEVIPPSAYLPV